MPRRTHDTAIGLEPDASVAERIVGGCRSCSISALRDTIARPLTARHPRPDLRALEAELLDRLNGLGIGPQELGGVVTALAVNIEVFPTHIAGLPVAVNIGCHSTRRATVQL